MTSAATSFRLRPSFWFNSWRNSLSLVAAPEVDGLFFLSSVSTVNIRFLDVMKGGGDEEEERRLGLLTSINQPFLMLMEMKRKKRKTRQSEGFSD